eukprot:scaffold42447_cov40-Cyclotella_meneghiniana.AAC.2
MDLNLKSVNSRSLAFTQLNTINDTVSRFSQSLNNFNDTDPTDRRTDRPTDPDRTTTTTSTTLSLTARTQPPTLQFSKDKFSRHSNAQTILNNATLSSTVARMQPPTLIDSHSNALRHHHIRLCCRPYHCFVHLYHHGST